MRLLFFPSRSDPPDEAPEQPPPPSRLARFIPFWLVYLVLVVILAGPAPFEVKLLTGFVLSTLLSRRGAFR